MTHAIATAIAPASPQPFAFDVPDAAFHRRWLEWKARGRAHEQRVHGRLVAGLAVALPLVLAFMLTRLFFTS